MKKVLLASVALLAVGTAAQAAEPVKLNIGGYMSEYVGYATNRDGVGATSETAANNGYKLNHVDVQSDVNVNFVGSTKLDNGVSVAVEVDTFGSQRKDSRNVAFNGASGNADVKRSFLTVGSAYGTIIAGEREDALYIVHNSAPDVGTVGLQDGTWFQWVVDPAYHRTYNTTNTSRYDDRTNKISYVTPSWNGLAAAASYVPNTSLSSSGHTTVGSSTADGYTSLETGLVNGQDLSGDVYGAGLAYANTFGGVSVKADLGAAQANAAGLELYQGGLRVGYAGFEFGGSILNRHVSDSTRMLTTNGGTTGLANATVKTAAYAGQSFDVGVSYTTGPMAVSLGYFHDTSKDDGSHTLVGSGGGADSTNVYVLSAAYTMGPGVVWQNSLAHVQYKSGDGSNSYLDRNSGNLLVTGMKVSF